ncbi:hypothetical protein Q9299_07845 [Gemmobacter fulvus]|uniref:hypothetical protein n=1 Tax=Gemmobacter fulvus TaxID=2840474 RepID=UPI0027969DF3|nr:hypothetical protein [Gemmobacter fulvus]MDQ1848198.1 hypothetical protein [Gemmobacter fulvus]
MILFDQLMLKRCKFGIALRKARPDSDHDIHQQPFRQEERQEHAEQMGVAEIRARTTVMRQVRRQAMALRSGDHSATTSSRAARRLLINIDNLKAGTGAPSGSYAVHDAQV